MLAKSSAQRFFNSYLLTTQMNPLASHKLMRMSHQMSRSFSTFSKIQGNSILISSSQSPKLRIPVSDSTQYDFTVRLDETVAQFEERVKSGAQGLKKFKVLSQNADKDQLMSNIIKEKFELEINKNKLQVYPNLENMIDQPAQKNKEFLDEIFEERSIPVARRVIIQHYLDHFIKTLEQSKDSKLTESKFKETLEKTLTEYSEQYSHQLLDNVIVQLNNAKEEQQKIHEQWQLIEARAERHAKLMLWGGFMMAAGQLVGMSGLIFSIYSWEVMEPVTYLVSAFYATVGTGFYIWLKHDFAFQNAYEAFKNRKLRKLIKKTKFDVQKKEFLDEYVQKLEEQIKTLKNID